MSELQVQLLIVFCFKQVLLGSLEIIIPFVKARARATVRELEIADMKSNGAHSNDLHAVSDANNLPAACEFWAGC